MREIIKPAAILLAVCVLTTIALAGMKLVTQGTIDARAAADLENAKREVLAAASSFERLPEASFKNGFAEGASNEFLETIKEVYVGRDAGGQVVGLVFGVKSRGYEASGIKMTIGVDLGGTVQGIKVIENLETPGLGTNVLAPEGAYMSQYKNKQVDAPLRLVKVVPHSDLEIQAVAGATITSRAVYRGVEGALEFTRNLLGSGGIQ